MPTAQFVNILDDPEQWATLAARVAAAETLGARDARLERPALLVPAGAFWHGTDEPGGHPNEWPRRQLILSSFAIDPYPVTVLQFARFIESGGYQRRELWSEAGWQLASSGRPLPRFWDEPEWKAYLTPNRPVVGVSWYEADAFARWLGRRLPTEAEWERAAAGVQGREYPWGQGFQPSLCHHRGGFRGTLPVGCFPGGCSEVGAFDMSGNVWEWCQDWFDPGYYEVAPDRDPPGPAQGQLRVARGGAWNTMPGQLRCANRNAWPPEARYSNLGFRLAG